MKRFDGAKAWRNLAPQARDRIGAIAVELAVARFTADRAFDADTGRRHDAAVGRAAEHADVILCHLLDEAVLASLPQDLEGTLPIPWIIGAVCRGCGCSGNDACAGGCSWVEPDLCSACVGKENQELRDGGEPRAQ